MINIIHYTVHSTQYTVHSTQYTVHSTQYAVHSIQYTVHSIQYTVHSTQYTVHSTQYTVHSIRCGMYNVYCIIYILRVVSRQNVIGIRTKCQKTKYVITRTLTLILGHTLTVTGPLPQWRSKGGPPRAAKLRLYLKIWKSVLKGRNFRKGLQKSRR